MAWSVYGPVMKTADFSGTPVFYQPVKFHKNIALKVARTWVIKYNTPVFTTLVMRVYSNNGGVPGKLLYTSSNSWTPTQVSSYAHAVRDLYFEFDAPPVFQENDTYHFVLWATGYTGTDSTHISWKRAWPDPVYTTNLSTTFVTLGRAPFDLTFIGAEL